VLDSRSGCSDRSWCSLVWVGREVPQAGLGGAIAFALPRQMGSTPVRSGVAGRPPRQGRTGHNSILGMPGGEGGTSREENRAFCASPGQIDFPNC
jgi:hypothetical protein